MKTDIAEVIFDYVAVSSLEDYQVIEMEGRIEPQYSKVYDAGAVETITLLGRTTRSWIV